MMQVYTDLHIRARASASKNEIEYSPEGWRMKIKAPPVEGKANKEIISYLSRLLKVPKKSIEIKSGQNNPYKVIRVTGLDEETCIVLLSGLSQ